MMNLLVRKNKITMLMLSCGLMIGLYGCDESKVDAESAVSGDVVSNESMSYYEESVLLISAYVDFIETTYKPVMNRNTMTELHDSYIQATQDFMLYSQEFDAVPTTKEELLLSEQVFNIQYHADLTAKYTLEYLYKNDTVYLDLIKDNFTFVRMYTDTFMEVENKYFK